MSETKWFLTSMEQTYCAVCQDLGTTPGHGIQVLPVQPAFFQLAKSFGTWGKVFLALTAGSALP